MYRLILNVATIGLSDGTFGLQRVCTVLVSVPTYSGDPYFHAELFRSLDAKLAANQDRFDRIRLHQGFDQGNSVNFQLILCHFDIDN